METADHAIVMTGATGFVGSIVLEELLRTSARPVVALVRAADDAAANARLRALAQSTWGDPGALGDRVSALAADVERPGLGLDEPGLARLAARTESIIHCAASIQFDLSLQDARAINVEGTRRVVDLALAARRRGARGRLVHVSTAYVHGRSRGLAREDGPAPGPTHRNSYEQSKYEAEAIVRALGEDTAIVRPSIVVGDSQTGWTSSFNVIYVPLRAADSGLLTVIPGRPDAWLDLVPVDQVARAVATLALHEDAAGTFQAVAGEQASRLRPFADIVCRVLGIPPARCDPAAADQLGLYAPYADVAGPFELRRARPLGIEPLDAEELVPRILEFARSARWGKRSVLRPMPAAFSPAVQHPSAQTAR